MFSFVPINFSLFFWVTNRNSNQWNYAGFDLIMIRALKRQIKTCTPLPLTYAHDHSSLFQWLVVEEIHYKNWWFRGWETWGKAQILEFLVEHEIWYIIFWFFLSHELLQAIDRFRNMHDLLYPMSTHLANLFSFTTTSIIDTKKLPMIDWWMRLQFCCDLWIFNVVAERYIRDIRDLYFQSSSGWAFNGEGKKVYARPICKMI